MSSTPNKYGLVSTQVVQDSSGTVSWTITGPRSMTALLPVGTESTNTLTFYNWQPQAPTPLFITSTGGLSPSPSYIPSNAIIQSLDIYALESMSASDPVNCLSSVFDPYGGSTGSTSTTWQTTVGTAWKHIVLGAGTPAVNYLSDSALYGGGLNPGSAVQLLAQAIAITPLTTISLSDLYFVFTTSPIPSDPQMNFFRRRRRR